MIKLTNEELEEYMNMLYKIIEMENHINLQYNLISEYKHKIKYINTYIKIYNYLNKENEN